MTDDLLSTASSRPALPEPRRERWQPLRLGLVELFHYDSEEFWFHDGHLLLRGNNGTGKSKVLSLTLPLLFDAQLRPARVEPDGDAGKKMAWNLLLGSYPRRIGYSWIEFGRREGDGRARYLTLGVGLSAVAGRAQVDSWYFLIEGDGVTADPRIGEDLWLTTAARQVLARERLREALVGRGQLFESAQAYRRAVDERLFHLGAHRYDALMDTLIQLRQPQLSKKPDESGLSHALGESLPPLPTDLLGDVAEALNQLEEDRNQLEDTRRLEQAVVQFERRYRTYAGMLARRQARELRQAQTGFDNASEARNRAQAEGDAAREAEREAVAALGSARQAYTSAQERLDTLQSDPANQDANRLSQAESDAKHRRDQARAATTRRDTARTALQREAERSQQQDARAAAAHDELEASRTRVLETSTAVGLDAELVVHPWLAASAETLAASPPDPRASADALRGTVVRRRSDLAHLRRRHAEIERNQVALSAHQENVLAARADTEDALQQREQADRDAEQAGAALVEAWSGYCADLRHLRFDAAEPLCRLTDWVARPDGDNPALSALTLAWRSALQRHATCKAELDALRQTQRQLRSELEAERERLLAGKTAAPPPPATRAAGVREGRSGAPLWQLVDFQPHLSAADRAGLEAALEASGLLDAWLSQDGVLTGSDGHVLFDTHWQHRTVVSGTRLVDALLPSVPEGCQVSQTAIAMLLAGVAYGTQDRVDVESWLSPDGRFRLGALAGAWNKPEARYIGHAARERSRRLRLEEIASTLVALDATDAQIEQQASTLDMERQETERERQGVPSDRSLQDAIAPTLAAAREVERTRQRFEQVEARRRDAEATLRDTRELLRRDAADLRLPTEVERLPALDQALEDFDHAQARLAQAVREWQHAWPELVEQRRREDEATQATEQAEEERIQAETQATQALTRFETLRQAVGQQVDELHRRLAAAREERGRTEHEANVRQEAASKAGTVLALAVAHAEQAEQALAERIDERQRAVERLRHFAGSGLLASALSGLELPEHWSVDPALNLARRIEQALVQVADDEAASTRVQKQIAEDLTELQRGLGALGHQAVSEPNDWGITVAIQYQSRAERPDTLATLLAEDIAQRSELLSAKEREVLENHLQAEIAAEIQRLMRGADERVTAINAELYKRPTTTGVRYRLQWEPLTVEEGAPVGLADARRRLLNTSADLWSAEDRTAVGVMLQQQITAERARADTEAAGSSLIDQLARALDYRHWHRFRILRQQDGQWRKLSGPASSGERALGLTVPLFAAIASFYGQGGNPLAPRLMLLDEAFAGIDDTARAHCMGLVREFDLDFVITSEREWACYAELPGVAICQLQRREGIDAVFVSRWLWDGSAPRVQDDPDRRFPPA